MAADSTSLYLPRHIFRPPRPAVLSLKEQCCRLLFSDKAYIEQATKYVELDLLQELYEQACEAAGRRSPFEPLTLTGMRSPSSELVRRIAERYNTLVTLRVNSCPNFDSECLQYISKLPFLRDLDCGHCLKVQDHGVDRFLSQRGGSMRSLCLSGTSVTCRVSASIALFCGQLQRLELEFVGIGTKHVARMGPTCAGLRYINFGHCTAVTHEACKAIAHSCRLVQVLNLKYCTRIGDKGVAHLMDCTHLEELRLDGARVGDYGVIKVVQSCKSLLRLYLRE